MAGAIHVSEAKKSIMTYQPFTNSRNAQAYTDETSTKSAVGSFPLKELNHDRIETVGR